MRIRLEAKGYRLEVKGSDMLEQLLHIDTEILLAINGWHAPWADTLMWIISAKTTWIPLYLLLIGLLV